MIYTDECLTNRVVPVRAAEMESKVYGLKEGELTSLILHTLTDSEKRLNVQDINCVAYSHILANIQSYRQYCAQ